MDENKLWATNLRVKLIVGMSQTTDLLICKKMRWFLEIIFILDRVTGCL